LGNNSGWETDSQVLAPELVILSGDLMENPAVIISEYDTAYQRLVNLGSPVLITSGNHDQKNLGPWFHYFGSSFGGVVWSDVKIGYMTNILPVGTPVFEYMNKIFTENKKSVNIMAYHYPPEPSYAGASWLSLLQMALSNNIDAVLAGHMHIDAVAPIEELFQLSTITEGREGLVLILSEISEQREYLGPITRPQLILTRSAGKTSGSVSEYISASNEDDIHGYSGYRRLVIQNNKIVNYTYDYNNSGVRDAHNCIPIGRLNWTITKDANFGINPSAKAYITLINNLNEYITSSRIPILLENAPTGKIWAPTASNLTSGVYIRTQFSNVNQTWLDVRAPLSPNQNITVVIEMASGG
jgi:predicted phosphodiesterase